MLKVKINPGIKAYKKHGSEIEINWSGGTLRDLMEILDINLEEVSNTLVNGSIKSLDVKLEDHSQVVFLSTLCGG